MPSQLFERVVIFWGDDPVPYMYCYKNEWECTVSSVIIFCGCVCYCRNMFINMMDNAIFKSILTNYGIKNESSGGDPLINTYIMPIPVITPMNITIDIASILGGILYPFAYSFLIPVSAESTCVDCSVVNSFKQKLRG